MSISIPQASHVRCSEGRTGTEFRWRPDLPSVLEPAGNPRAVVVICHGVNSHGGQYTWAAEQLVAGGFSVYALDLRGRGKSDGPHFYVETVADYVSDLSAVIQLPNRGSPACRSFC